MRKNVLVYQPDALIAEDIAATVREVLEGACVRVADSIEAIGTLLSQHQGWAWAVIDARSNDLARDDLLSAFAESDALPVVLSQPVEDPEVSNWVFLDPPFNTEMLRAALEKTRPPQGA